MSFPFNRYILFMYLLITTSTFSHGIEFPYCKCNRNIDSSPWRVRYGMISEDVYTKTNRVSLLLYMNNDIECINPLQKLEIDKDPSFPYRNIFKNAVINGRKSDAIIWEDRRNIIKFTNLNVPCNKNNSILSFDIARQDINFQDICEGVLLRCKFALFESNYNRGNCPVIDLPFFNPPPFPPFPPISQAPKPVYLSPPLSSYPYPNSIYPSPPVYPPFYPFPIAFDSPPPFPPLSVYPSSPSPPLPQISVPIPPLKPYLQWQPPPPPPIPPQPSLPPPHHFHRNHHIHYYPQSLLRHRHRHLRQQG